MQVLTRREWMGGILAQAVANRTPLIMDHDGGVPDDYVAMAMLFGMKNVDLRGVVVTPGVSFLEPAVSVTRKLLDLGGRSQVPVAKSAARAANPFPTEWRKKIYVVDALPILNQSEPRAPLASETGEQFLVRLLKQSAELVTILATGPLSTIAGALKLDSSIEGKVREIVWMGGALRVAGNVHPTVEPSHDGTAEWNVYCDPIAAFEVWKTRIPIVLCPLDATNKVPVTTDVVRRLASLRAKSLADFAGQINALAFSAQDLFYFWDALAAAWIGKPELFRVDEWEVAVIPDGVSQGRTIQKVGARKIRVMDPKDPRAFYDYFFKLLG